MIELRKTSTSDPHFVAMVNELNAELAIRDGDDHEFYNQYNKLHDIKYVIVAYENGMPVGCGAIKKFDSSTMEVKRMYVADKARGKGIATAVLEALEIWAKNLSFTRCILETGIRQPEAIALYKKSNYRIISNYGQYKGIMNSVCFEKWL